jgi:hypothetical protein
MDPDPDPAIFVVDRHRRQAVIYNNQPIDALISLAK